MEKIIIYQTNNSVGYCDKSHREEWVYEKQILPIRLLVTLASNDFLEDLKNMESHELIDMLTNELSDINTLYSN